MRNVYHVYHFKKLTALLLRQTLSFRIITSVKMSSKTSELADSWNRTNDDLKTPQSVRKQWWDVIHKMYGEPQRYYHTLQHIEELFQHFDWCRDKVEFQHPTLVSLAIFFHDIVYDPKASDNEEKSADLFMNYAQDCGVLTEKDSQKVKHWILLTKTHKVDTPTNFEDYHYFLDMDIAVLGRPSDGYKQYASQIRLEYQHVQEEVYRERRAQVLKTFLDRDRLFITDIFHQTYTKQAHQNLQKEIDGLLDRNIPLDCK